MLCDWSTPFLALPPPHLSSQPAALLRSDLLSWYPERKSQQFEKPLLRDSYPFISVEFRTMKNWTQLKRSNTRSQDLLNTNHSSTGETTV